MILHEVGEAMAGADGAWTVTAATQAPGTYAFLVLITDLAGQRLVSVSRDSANRLLLDQATADLPEQPVAWYECNHVAGALALVEAGLGLAVLPQLALSSDSPRVCGVPMTAPDLWRTLGLLQRRDRVLAPAAEALRQRLLQLRAVD